MAKRKVDSENGAFQNRWEAEYMFIDIVGEPLCLICGGNVAVIKEFPEKPECRADARESRRVKEESDISADVFHKSEITKWGCCESRLYCDRVKS